MSEPIHYTLNVEAMQLTVSNVREIEEWCGLRVQLRRSKKEGLFVSIQWLDDLVGRHDLGDYMVKNSKGTFTVQSQEDFEKGGWSKESLREKLIEIHTPYGIYDICDHEHTDDGEVEE
jgi:hypothetical protein